MSGASGSIGPLHLLAYLSDGASASAAKAALGNKPAEVHMGHVSDATQYLAANPSPEILLVEVPSAEEAPVLLDKLADVVNPATRVIVTGRVDTLSFYRWLLSLGIHDYLLEPFTEAQLLAVLDKNVQTNAPAGTAAPQTKKLISVIGARGGVGTTTIAIHLAAILAKEHGAKTALLDLDPHFGSVALGLDLEPGRGLREALEKPDRVDALFLERVMVRPFSPLSILSAEEPLAEHINAQAGASDAVIKALFEQFPFVIADLPRQMDSVTHDVLAQSDRVILVAEPNLLNLRDALRLKDYLVDTLKRPAPLVVLNKVGLAARQELSKGDFTKHYGAPAHSSVPYSEEAIAAMSRGETLLGNPRGKGVVEPLRALASEFSDAIEAPKEEKKSAFSFLKGK